MNYKTFNKDMFDFINHSTCSFLGIKTIKKILLNNNFIELYEKDIWNLNNYKKYFVIRNDSSIIAFSTGKNSSFNITCTHVDTPSLAIKPKNIINEKNYIKINVNPYGGLLNYAWLDEALSISGRIITKNNNVYKKEIIDFRENLLCIPSVAIHQNDNANSNLTLNSQIDMIPIISLKKEKDPIKKLIQKKIKGTICDYDLYLYSTSKPEYFGLNKDFIISPRIDDLVCVYSALRSFLDANSKNNINIFCAFNSEEIGSLTAEGADSSFLMDVLKRIAGSLEKDISILINNSTILSADNTHATHPNHPDNSDVTNEALLNNGIIISKDASSTTNSITSSIFKELCKKVRVPYQDFTTKNDMSSGSTLSGISLRHVSIDSIDIGLSELAMHGAKEIIGAKDPFYLYKAFKIFYETNIIKDDKKITLDF